MSSFFYPIYGLTGIGDSTAGIPACACRMGSGIKKWTARGTDRGGRKGIR